MTGLTLRIRPDKTGSACLPFDFGPYLNVRPEPDAREGSAIVGRVLTTNPNYGQLESPSGRLSQLVPGDVIVGVLGNRAALRGFSGRVPQTLQQSQTVHLLNKGGVIGISQGTMVGLGKPIELEVLGTPLIDGKPANLADFALPPHPEPQEKAPVLAVVGTCMNSGKSTAAAVAIRHFRSLGRRVHAGKATGVAAVADPLSFRDQGAAIALSFLDCGVPSTAYRPHVPELFRTLLGHLWQEGPDLVVIELGDGVLGAYGVDEILESSPPIDACIVAANDVVGGWAVTQKLRDLGLPVTVVTGPATDNEAGVEKLESLGVPAANIIRDQAKFCDLVQKALP